VVKKCNPEKIYTFHGFAERFAENLSLMGFDAEPLVRKKGKRIKTIIKLDSFLSKSNP
jgi:putative mRNA 3-end processing factor